MTQARAKPLRSPRAANMPDGLSGTRQTATGVCGRSQRRSVPAPEHPIDTGLPPIFAAEVRSLEQEADELLQRCLPGRRRSEHVVAVVMGLCAATHRQRTQALLTDRDLALVGMGLRCVGERLAALGGALLLEAAAERVVPDGSQNAELRRTLLRTSWHRLGDRGREFRA